MPFGGSGFTGPLDPDYIAAEEEFIEWSFEQAWGCNAETTGAAQFQAMADKLRELGLPLQDAWRPR